MNQIACVIGFAIWLGFIGVMAFNVTPWALVLLLFMSIKCKD